MTEIVQEEVTHTVVVNAPGTTNVVESENSPEVFVAPTAEAPAVVVDRVQQVNVQELGQPGPTGPKGDAGPIGPAGPKGTTSVVGNIAYIHTQNEPSDTWLISHNMSFFPAVSVVDSGDSVVEGSVRYLDDNTVEVTFGSVFGGRAYLS